MKAHPPSAQTPGRNDPCPCGSGRKYKSCCAAADLAAAREADLAQAQLRRGLAAERNGRVDDALRDYGLAAAFPATRGAAASRLGHLLLTLGRAGEAAQALRRAAETDPDDPDRRMDLVRALITEKRDAEAEAEVRRALALHPDHADGQWLLGRILSEAGRFDEARAAFARAVALSPDQGAAWYDLVRSFTLGEADRPLVARMLQAARAVTDYDQRVRLHLALGKAYDDFGDYAAAMDQFGKANTVKSAMVRFDERALAARVDRQIAGFTPEVLAARAAGGDSSRLPVLVVGLPRSGTTLVEQILSSHSQVEGAGELQFWPACGQALERMASDAAFADLQRRAAAEGLSTLRALAPDASRVVDKNPFNFLWAGLVHTVFPQALIVHCRRDALDTCLSIQSTYFSPRPEFSTDRADLVAYVGHYRRLMDHWRAVLPGDRFVEVDYEALVADPEPIARGLIAACGLDWEAACLRPEANSRVVRTASKWQARQPINGSSVGRWRRYEPWLGPLRDLTPN